MLAVVDKDPRKKELIPTIAPVNENVIPKVERDLLLKQISYLKQEIERKRTTENMKVEMRKMEKD